MTCPELYDAKLELYKQLADLAKQRAQIDTTNPRWNDIVAAMNKVNAEIADLNNQINANGCKEISCSGDGHKVCWELPYSDIQFTDCELNPAECCAANCKKRKNTLIRDLWQDAVNTMREKLNEIMFVDPNRPLFVNGTMPSNITLQQLFDNYMFALNKLQALGGGNLNPFQVIVKGSCMYVNNECKDELDIKAKGDAGKFDFGNLNQTKFQLLGQRYSLYDILIGDQNTKKRIDAQTRTAAQSDRSRDAFFSALHNVYEAVYKLIENIINTQITNAEKIINQCNTEIGDAERELLKYSGEAWRESTRQKALAEIKKAYLDGLDAYPLDGTLEYRKRLVARGPSYIVQKTVKANSVSLFSPGEPGCIVATAPSEIDGLDSGCGPDQPPGFAFPIRVSANWEMRGTIILPDYLEKKLNHNRDVNLGTITATDCHGDTQ